MVAVLMGAVLMEAEAVHMVVARMVANEVVVIDRVTHATDTDREEVQAVVVVMVVVAMVATGEEARNLVATVDQVVEAPMHLVVEDGVKDMAVKAVVTMAVTPDRVVITEGTDINEQDAITIKLNV